MCETAAVCCRNTVTVAGVMKCYGTTSVNMESKHFEIRICQEAGELRETGDQTDKDRRNLGSIQRLQRLGAGAETHSTCPETHGQGSHYPPPALTSMNLILKNNVRRGERGGRGDERIISLGNK